jgi:hypothetical protein
MGILKYGTREYTPNKTQAFQEGGSVAVSRAYDWRDDPYELMLLQQKAAQTTAGIRASGRKSNSASSANKKIDTFSRIEGGLPVTNDAINDVTSKSQEDYYNKVRSGEEGWASTTEGQIEFQKIVNEGKRLQEKAKTEETNFTNALGKIDSEDMQTYAISSRDGLMVRDATGKGQRVNMSTYVSNIDKFSVMTINDFSEWKKNEDTALQSQLTDEFLKENAVGYNTMRKTYIDGKEDTIQYAFRNGQIVKKGATGDALGPDIYDVELFKKGLNNMMAGGGFYGPDSTVAKESQTSKGLEVVNTIYSDIMGGSAKDSRLGASLTAELLRDQRHIENISKISGVQEKINYIEEKKKLLLVSKIVDKNTKPSSGGGSESDSEDSPEIKHKTTGTALLADLEAVYNPNEVSQFTIGVNTDDIKKRTVNDVNMPMVRGGLTSANLKLVIDPEASPDVKNAANNFMQNQAIDAYSDKSELYLPSGQNFRSLLGNSAEAVRQFISEDAVIAPNQNMPIVFVPMDASGKVRIQDMLKLTPMKIDARKAFIKSSKGKLGTTVISTPAENLLPGNMSSKAQSDTREYTMWIQKGMEVERYRKESIANPNSTPAANNFAMAMDAQKVIQNSSATFKRVVGGAAISLQPMLGTWIVFDNDRYNLVESVKTVIAGGFGKDMILKASPKEKEFLQGVNKIDITNYFDTDNVHKMMVFTKIKSLKKSSAEQGEKLQGLAVMGELDDKMANFMSTRSALTDAGNYGNIQNFLIQ